MGERISPPLAERSNRVGFRSLTSLPIARDPLRQDRRRGDVAAETAISDPGHRGPEGRSMLLVPLVHAQTGILEFIGEFPPPADFTRRPHVAIREQTPLGCSADRYRHALAGLHRKRPTADAMVDAGRAECVGEARHIARASENQ